MAIWAGTMAHKRKSYMGLDLAICSSASLRFMGSGCKNNSARGMKANIKSRGPQQYKPVLVNAKKPMPNKTKGHRYRKQRVNDAKECSILFDKSTKK